VSAEYCPVCVTTDIYKSATTAGDNWHLYWTTAMPCSPAPLTTGFKMPKQSMQNTLLWLRLV